MEPSTRAKLIEKLGALLAREPDVRLALLFGSWARGDASEGSDVDLAVDGAGLDLHALAGHLSA